LSAVASIAALVLELLAEAMKRVIDRLEADDQHQQVDAEPRREPDDEPDRWSSAEIGVKRMFPSLMLTVWTGVSASR
jgi:hypothetical protein